MSRGGFRAAGFMDGFMNGFDFVDRLQRLDQERSDRRARDAQEDAYRQQLYDLREGQEQERGRSDDALLTEEQLRVRAQRRYDEEMQSHESNRRARDFRDWQMERERAAAASAAPASRSNVRPGRLDRRRALGEDIRALQALSPYIRNERLLEQLRGEYGLLEGHTATSPKTGQRLIHRSGRWEAIHE